MSTLIVERSAAPPIISPPKVDAGLYSNASSIAGPLSNRQTVQYKSIVHGKDKTRLSFVILLNILTGGVLVTWLLQPKHFPVFDGTSRIAWLAGTAALLLVVGIELIRLVQISALWSFATKAKDPHPMTPQAGTRVAVLTTIVPSKEPLDLVLRTLQAMKQLQHDGTVDVWLLDEGDDPDVRRAVEEIGVNHFSRKGVAQWNTTEGAFKAKTKAGNHNAWRDAHEHEYDVVAQMDPDHIPAPDFLKRTLGYFKDPDVGFVVAPQVYGNLEENWIAKGSAEQAYVFHGVIQRGANALGAPLLIGTNHLYRPTAWRQIDGYQDSIIEDHLTAMTLYGTTNPETGRKWKGVYTPDIIAIGEGPTSFADYFNQQKRWAYGIWEIIGKKDRTLFPQLTRSQRFAFALIQLFYPSVALSWLFAAGANTAYVLGGAMAHISAIEWSVLWLLSLGTSIGTFFWLRRFNLIAHERRGGWTGLALLLTAIPIYTAAAIEFLFRRPLAYVVTAKGNLTSPDRLQTFSPHMFWTALGLVVLALGVAFGGITERPQMAIWAVFSMIVAALPLVIFGVSKVRNRSGKVQT